MLYNPPCTSNSLLHEFNDKCCVTCGLAVDDAVPTHRLKRYVPSGRKACVYCGVGLVKPCPPPCPPNMATIDHVIPKSRGGNNLPDNRVDACLRCNNEKGDKLLEEWVDRWYLRKEKEAVQCQLKTG